MSTHQTSLQQTPLIVDTDIGGDPDDAIALAIAARLPQLRLVLTNDEPPTSPGMRARFARHLLDLLKRDDVAVCSGARGGPEATCCVQALVPDAVPVPSGDMLTHVRALAAAHSGTLRWLGIGPMSNLALVLERAPEIARRLQVTQMGGALEYRRPDRAEHNVRYDVAAARRVFAAQRADSLNIAWILADVTFTPHTQLTADSALFHALSAGEPWARLIAAHMQRWFETAYPHTMQHDSVALSVALDLPYVTLEHTRIRLADDGRMSLAADGELVRASRSAHYEALMSWLTNALRAPS